MRRVLHAVGQSLDKASRLHGVDKVMTYFTLSLGVGIVSLVLVSLAAGVGWRECLLALAGGVLVLSLGLAYPYWCEWLTKRFEPKFPVPPQTEFDRYCTEHNIDPGEEPAAFAAWMHETTGWDGDMRKVDDDE